MAESSVSINIILSLCLVFILPSCLRSIMEFISALGSFLGFTTPEEPDEIILVEPPDLPQRKFTLKELQSFNGKNLISEYSKECKPVSNNG